MPNHPLDSRVCLKKDSHDLFLQLPVITLPCFSIKGVVGKYIFNVEFPLRKTLDSKGWLGSASLSQLSQFFNFPLIAYSRLLDLCRSLP